MDISIPINGMKLNIRVTVLLETKRGFIFEKDKNGFFFPVGGRIKINENSIDAAKREIKEELGIDITDLEYKATIENFYQYENIPFHEINIIHQVKIKDFKCPNGFYAFKYEHLDEINIKPKAIKDIISKKSDGNKHFVLREKNNENDS